MGHKDAEIWERVFREHADEFRAAPPTQHQQDCLDFLRRHDVSTVLDIGCGIGRWTIHLARAGLQVCAFDLSRTAVEVARRWAAEEALSAEIEQASVEDPAFADRRFDAVVAAMVLDNLPTRVMDETLRRIEQWLRPEGVFFALFNPFLTPAQIEELAATPNPTTGVDTHYYSDRQLASFLEAFEVLSTRVYEQGIRGFSMRRRGSGG